jgi:hypothetical protein
LSGDQGCVVIIGDESDSLSMMVAHELQQRKVPVTHFLPSSLANRRVRIRHDSFTVDGQPARGVLWRCVPGATFSADFISEDRSFCDAEVRATWLCAMNLSSVLAVNHYDAAAWFEGPGWTIWRRRLLKAGVPVSSFSYGATESPDGWAWFPYNAFHGREAPRSASRRTLGTALSRRTVKQRSLIVCGEVMTGESSSAVVTAVGVLNRAGIQIAEAATDLEGRILTVNTEPNILDSALAQRASRRIVELYAAHLRDW